MKVKRGRFKRPLEPPLAPRSRVSISRQPPSTVQQQVFIKNKDVVCDHAFIIAKHNFIIIDVFSVSSLLQRPSFPLIRTAPEWWHTPVVDSSKKCPRQKPCASCHLSRKEPYNGEKLLVATACVTMDENRFMSYTDKFKIPQ